MIKTMNVIKLNSRNRRPKVTLPPPPPLRLDLGAGQAKKSGFTGVDCLPFPGVDVVTDLRKEWPWKDGSVEEANSSHCLEHFDATERVHFFNELWRVLKPGGKCTIITPHWASCRAYGDPTHKWPPVSEFLWYYLKRDWRLTQAPHTDSQHNKEGFTCNFEVTWGYGLTPEVASRNQEYQQYAMAFLKEAISDMIATLVKV